MHPGPISGRGFVASMGGAFASFYLSLAHLILISRMPNPSIIEERNRLLAVYRLSKVCIKRKSDHRDCGIEFWKLQQDLGVAAPQIHRWVVAKVGFCNRSGVRLSLAATGCAEDSKCHRDIVRNHRFFGKSYAQCCIVHCIQTVSSHPSVIMTDSDVFRRLQLLRDRLATSD